MTSRALLVDRFDKEQTSGASAIETLRREDVAAAARLYVAAFPDMVRELFDDCPAAQAFYADFFELLRSANNDTCLAALEKDELAGFIILTRPDGSLARAMLREGYWWRCVRHGLTGRYGFSLKFLARMLRGLSGTREGN